MHGIFMKSRVETNFIRDNIWVITPGNGISKMYINVLQESFSMLEYEFPNNRYIYEIDQISFTEHAQELWNKTRILYEEM